MPTFAIALPDDPELIERLVTALQVQSDPPVTLARARQTVITFESITPPMMLQARVIQALEVAAGPDWQRLVRPID